jgi:hypothetical protein
MKFISIFLLLFCINFISSAQNSIFKKHSPCAFSIELPSEMKLSKMFSDESLDFCDYEVKLKDGSIVMELHSLVLSRCEFTTIKEYYEAALKASVLNITYKVITGNFFVISGLNKDNGKIVYWKRVLGDNYLSDMRIEYSETQKKNIEPHIGKISKSFKSN